MMKDHNGATAGATAVEFAIILPVLILVLFGIIEFSLVLFNKHIITNASREGARAGIVARDPGKKFIEGVDPVDIEAVVNDWLGDHLVTFGDTDADTVYIEILECDNPDPHADCGDPGTGSFYELYGGYAFLTPCTFFECPLRVTVRYDYNFLVLSIFGFGPITLDGTSEMRME
jgi:hypothetical protein